MSAKHTLGPWIAQIPNIGENPFERDERGNQYWEIKPVEMLFDGRYLDVTAWTSEANARLIAAAPDLFDALKEALKVIEFFHEETPFEPNSLGYEALMSARAAIAKATGEPQ